MVFGINKVRFVYEQILDKLHKRAFGEDYILNINRNLLNPGQKKVLFIYITKIAKTDFNSAVYHPNLMHCLQMLNSLIQMGYAVDLFHTRGVHSIQYVQKEYDLILGFGPLYEQVIEKGIKGYPVLYLTENDPRSVSNLYRDRIEYYKERHADNQYKKSLSRESFYTSKQIELSKACIAMTSLYNLEKIKKDMSDVYSININGLKNQHFVFDEQNAERNKRNFVWFGSNGCLHKGLDILVDAFAKLPDCTLSIYGLPSSEYSIIKKKLTPNIHYKTSVNVHSDAFITDVVNKHCFVVSASCSEGMNSGIATCMRHGLIPVVTKETGYEPHECIIEFEDYKVEHIISKVKQICEMDDAQVRRLSRITYEYGNMSYSLEAFTERFNYVLTIIRQKF